MLAAHTDHHASRPSGAPLRAVCWPPSQAEKPSSLPAEIRWLRAEDRKVALRRAYRYRAGGEKVDVIAIDLGVSRAKAAKMLSASYGDGIGDAHLERVRDRNPAVRIALIESVKLGIGAPAREAA